MPFTIFRFPDFQTLIPPNSDLGWIVLIALFSWLGWIAWKEIPDWRAWGKNQWRTIAALLIATLLAPAIFVFRLPIGEALPIPGLGPLALGPHMPIFLAFPWMLAIAIFGAFPGIILALISGSLMALWDTRSVFTAIEFGILAAAFSGMLNQSYRTRLFANLRKSWLAGIALALAYPILNFLADLFWLGADLSQALDFTISKLLWASVANSLPLIIGALLISGIVFRFPAAFPHRSNLQPSPAERNLQARVFSALAPIAILLFLSLAAVTWIVAGRASRQSLYGQLSESVEIASKSVPFMLETGQNQILNIASDVRLATTNSSQLSAFLEEKLQQLPFFEQLVLVDLNLNTLAAFPVSDFQGIQPTESEIDAINRAFNGVPVQTLTVPPFSNLNRGAQLSYIAAVSAGSPNQSVLIGRSQIESNPFAQSIILSLDDYLLDGASGILLDGDGKVIFHSRGENILQFIGEAPAIGVSDVVDGNGNRWLVAFQPADGSNWSILVQVPSSLLQQLALDIAFPQLLLLLLLGGLTFVLLRISLIRVSKSVDKLVAESSQFASGKKAKTERPRSSDEIGRLGFAIEEMQSKMQKRLDESDQLLEIAEAVVQDIDIHRQIDLIMQASLAQGASSVRIVLNQNSRNQKNEFAKGPQSREYRNLDEQIRELCGQQKRVLLTNPARTPLKFGKQKVPGAISIFALTQKSSLYGHMWMIFDAAQSFERDEVDFLEKLAGYAAMALDKKQEISSLEEAIVRSESVLINSMDPVLLLNGKDEILLVNRLAQELLSISSSVAKGKQIKEIETFSKSNIPMDAKSFDLQMKNGRSFDVQIIKLEKNALLLGRALILRDSTQNKQAEALRSEFLATVSHELQDPIELLRGYLTMLDMMGDLNEKQSAYTEKIVESVDNMSNLVNSLMDLERIESDLGLQLSQVSAKEIAEEVLSEIEPRAKQKQIKLNLSSSISENSLIEVDRTLIQRALYNLVDNAVRHGPRKESVTLSVGEEKGMLRFEITDNGAGIAPVDIPHVFERLRQSGAKNSKKRSGLGLSIVKSIVDRHGGEIWAESRLGQGSAFIMQLPKNIKNNLP